MNDRINIHPGEILLKEFLTPLGLSQNKLAITIHVPARRINEIVHGKRGITADTALRLGKFFGMTPGFWMGLQDEFELRKASYALKDELKAIKTWKTY
jgi:antitoxin HigA-1